MNKAEFISELGERLAVLTEDEQRDILDEYEQHIDIKVMRGMSEEAAIADFGRIEELAADILEAYHVRADYAFVERKGRGSFGGIFPKRTASGNDSIRSEDPGSDAEDAEERASGIMGWLNRGYEAVWRGMKRIGHGSLHFCRKLGRSICSGVEKTGKLFRSAAAELAAFCRRPFQKKEAEEAIPEAATEGLEETNRKSDGKRTERKRRMKEKSGFGIGSMIAGFFCACMNAVVWCIRWMWNLFCIGAGLLFGFGSCIVIFSMGALVVLLVLGYPLTGITIAWLGLCLCMVSVTAGCFSLVVSGKKKRKRPAGKNAAEAASETEDADIAGNIENEEEEMIHA